MLDCILIDDELKSIKSFMWELDHFGDELRVKEYFTDPTKALTYLHHNSVDFIFLDIEMPQMDGFEFLEKFPDRKFEVVFVTAYDEYAIDAIKESALDYLLKPVDREELEITVEKIKSHKRNIVQKEKPPETAIERISIPVDKKLIFIDPKDILYCKGDGNYCYVYTCEKKRIMVSRKLKYLEEILPEGLFFRVHHSYIVNLAQVVEYHRVEGYLQLSNSENIPVARSKKALFLERI